MNGWYSYIERSRRYIFCIGLAFAPLSAHAQNVFYGTNTGALQFTDGANWVGGVAPGTTNVAVIDSVDGVNDYPYIDSSVNIARFSIAAISSSTMGGLEFRNGANVTTSSSSSHFVGARGVGHLRILDGATLDLAGNVIVGWAASGTGTVNMSGGTVVVSSYLQIAREGVGSFIQTGGDLSLFRGTDLVMVVAPFAGADGTYEISGGSLTVTALALPGGVAVGAVDGSGSSTGTFKVVGNAPTITINGNYTQYAGGNLALDIGTGISPLGVTADATLAGNLNVSFTETPTVGQQFPILNYGGTLSGAFSAFDTLVDSPAGANSVGLSIDYGLGTASSIVITVDSVSAPLVPGDFDGDGDVDGIDFVAWQSNFPKASGAELDEGDADGDGDVDGADFVVWQTNFPYSPGPGASPVPEPNALILLAIGAMMVGVHRRRK